MKITRETAMQLWMRHYGYSAYAEDFDGGLMYRDAYGDPNYYIVRNGERIYCGWNIHHILPLARGGTDSSDNLICTNIITNELAADKITYWIEDVLYQVKRVAGTPRHEIVRLTCLAEYEVADVEHYKKMDEAIVVDAEVTEA